MDLKWDLSLLVSLLGWEFPVNMISCTANHKCFMSHLWISFSIFLHEWMFSSYSCNCDLKILALSTYLFWNKGHAQLSPDPPCIAVLGWALAEQIAFCGMLLFWGIWKGEGGIGGEVGYIFSLNRGCGFFIFVAAFHFWPLVTHSILMSFRAVSKEVKLKENEGLEQILLRSRCHKGRLLYYFPAKQR